MKQNEGRNNGSENRRENCIGVMSLVGWATNKEANSSSRSSLRINVGIRMRTLLRMHQNERSTIYPPYLHAVVREHT